MKESERWDDLVPEYEEQIFNVYENDRKKILLRRIKKQYNKKKNAADFGCGIGRALPLLAPYFKHVEAIDFSGKSLEHAKKYGYKNVTFKKSDLGHKRVRISRVDFILCVNVAIASTQKVNDQIIRNVINNLKTRGTAIFVIPSMESALFSTWKLIDVYAREKKKIKDIPKVDLERVKWDRNSLQQSMLYVNGIRTKHYLLPELFRQFQTPKTTLELIERVEYDWKTEIAGGNDRFGEPHPWDWLVEIKRK